MRVDPNFVLNLTPALNVSLGAEQTLTEELSSGLRVSSLDQDPVAASQNVLLSTSISRQDAYVQSSTHEQGQLQVTDSVLGEVVSDVTKAISLAVSAGGAALSAAELADLGSQVSGLRDNVISLANTSYLGQYVFSGSKGNTQPFVLNTATNPATTTYQGDTSIQHLATPDGQNIQVNLPGSSVFTAAGADLLGTINQLVSDLNSGNGGAVQTDTAALSNALGNVSTQRSVLGGSLARLTSTSTYASTQQTEFQAQQSTLLSADPATVATNLQTSEVQHQALLSVIAALGKSNNLFDRLQ